MHKLFGVITHRPQVSRKAQGILEFALALPVLLMLVFGIIEFGRLLQAWLALENGARFAVRYAVTGNYDPGYCEDAAHALTTVGAPYHSVTYHGQSGSDAMLAMDDADGQVDCMIPDTITNWEEMTGALQDWARLPSIRDNALAGAAGIAWDQETNVSGDYLGYLTNPTATFSQDYRGNPSSQGYLNIMTCSTRGSLFKLYGPPANPTYYDDIANPNNLFPVTCLKVQDGNNTFIDDGGGPGDHVRVELTYRHALITPFLSTWWPTLRLTSSREGIVEKYRTARVTGLGSGMAIAPTRSPTPTNTPTDTPTSTPMVCVNPTPGILLEYFDYAIGGTNVTDLINSPQFPANPSWRGVVQQMATTPNRDNRYGSRLRGYICPPYTGDYTFYIASDDSSVLLLSTTPNDPNSASQIASLTGWTTQNNFSASPSQTATVHLLACANCWYYIEALQKEGVGDDFLQVAWSGTGVNNTPVIIQSPFIKPAAPNSVAPVYCDGSKGVLHEDWTGILGSNLSDLFNAADPLDATKKVYPSYPNAYGIVPDFYYTRNADNYGARLQAYLCAPYTGDYTFWLASDDDSQLNLNHDANPATSMDPAGKSTIAHVNGWTYDQEYDKYSSQESTPIHLVAGQKYYIEGIFKESTGSDQISVAWTGPNLPVRQIIPNQYLLPLNPMPTRTPTVTPEPDCNSEVFSSPEALYLNDDTATSGPSYMSVRLNNTSPNYSASIYRITGQWLRDWATVAPDTVRPAKRLIRFDWMTGPVTFFTIPNGGLLLSNPPLSWDYSVNQVVAPLENSALRLYVDTIWGKQTFNIPNKLSEYFNYYHGNDFTLTIYYNVGTRTCPPVTVTGQDGPTLNPQRVTSGSRFSINSNAAAAATRSLEKVWFLVYNSSGTLVHFWASSPSSTGSGPYCLFGRSAGSCVLKDPYIDTWSEGSLITNDTYTVHIIARDNGIGGIAKYSTHVIYNLVINQAVPTASNTPSITPTPTTPPPPTNTPPNTNTPPPTGTPTPSDTPPPATETLTPTFGPSPTLSPTITPSPPPPPCNTPSELGGCK